MGKTAGLSTGYDDQHCRETTQYQHQKKVRQPAVLEIKKAYTLVSEKSICLLLGYTPQAYPKKSKRLFVEQVNNDLIIEQVRYLRKLQPRCGTINY